MNRHVGLRSSRWLVPGRILILALTLVVMFRALPPATQSASADEDYGTVYVHLHACGEFNGIPPTDMETLESACSAYTPYYNAVFLTTEGNTYKGRPINSFNNMDWIFDFGVPNHAFTLQAQVDLNGSTPIVYCQNGGDGEYQLMDATSNNGAGYVSATMAGGYVTCEWFAISRGPENTGTLSIDAFNCPADFDTSNAGMNDFYVACKDAENGATFVAVSDLNNSSKLISGDAIAGGVYWPYLVADSIQIAGYAKEGYEPERVYCRSQLHPTSVEFSNPGGVFGFDLAAGERMKCDWYDVPEAAAKVTIVNHLCPDGEDLSSTDIYTLTATCQQAMNGVTFTLDSAAESRNNVTGGNAASAIVWFDVIPTQATIREVPVPGYRTPRAFCLTTSSNGKQSDTLEQFIDDKNATSLFISEGDTIQCDYFNLPDGGVGQVGSIAIYPTACPADFDLASSDLDGAKQACTTPQDGTQFNLAMPNDIYTFTSGWYESGVATYFGIPSVDGLSLAATPRDGLRSGAVWCGQDFLANGQIDGYELMQLSTNTVPTYIVPGARETCYWFMVPANGQNVIPGATPVADDQSGDSGSDQNADSGDNGDANGGDSGDSGDNGGTTLDLNDQSTWTGRVEISVRVCPAGFDPNSADLWNECWENGNGIGFGIYSANQWWPQTSGDWADQTVIWDPVPQQDVIIQESIPAGFTTPIVFCDGAQIPVNGDGSINITVGDGAVVTCTFFNIPA